MSRHNVEVYRCVECAEEVVVVPAGFTMDEDELNQRAEDHRQKDCKVLKERAAQGA